MAYRISCTAASSLLRSANNNFTGGGAISLLLVPLPSTCFVSSITHSSHQLLPQQQQQQQRWSSGSSASSANQSGSSSSSSITIPSSSSSSFDSGKGRLMAGALRTPKSIQRIQEASTARVLKIQANLLAQEKLINDAAKLKPAKPRTQGLLQYVKKNAWEKE